VSYPLVTDKLRSYGAARRRVLRSVEHRQSKYLNNRAENSHQPTRQRERAMKRFTSAPARAAVSVRLQRHLPALSARPPPALRPGVPPRDDRPIHHLEPDHRHGHHSSLTQHQGSPEPAQPYPEDQSGHQVDNAPRTVSKPITQGEHGPSERDLGKYITVINKKWIFPGHRSNRIRTVGNYCSS
jgi:hypothetical protein